jgi:hypothetical protein
MHSYTLWTLAVTPFVFIFLAIIAPESRAGKIVRRLIHRLKKYN